MGTSLKAQKKIKGIGVLASLAASVGSFVFFEITALQVVFGGGFLILAIYLFWQMMKFMAGKGQRF